MDMEYYKSSYDDVLKSNTEALSALQEEKEKSEALHRQLDEANDAVKECCKDKRLLEKEWEVKYHVSSSSVRCCFCSRLLCIAGQGLVVNPNLISSFVRVHNNALHHRPQVMVQQTKHLEEENTYLNNLSLRLKSEKDKNIQVAKTEMSTIEGQLEAALDKVKNAEDELKVARKSSEKVQEASDREIVAVKEGYR